jgi:hypothetical protein
MLVLFFSKLFDAEAIEIGDVPSVEVIALVLREDAFYLVALFKIQVLWFFKTLCFLEFISYRLSSLL